MSKVELSEGVRIGNENLVRVTESASQKISTLIDREQKGDFLRITGGGCNGLSYKMKFTPTSKSGIYWSKVRGLPCWLTRKRALP